MKSLVTNIIHLLITSIFLFISIQLLSYCIGIHYNFNYLDYIIISFIQITLYAIFKTCLIGVMTQALMEKFKKEV